MSLRDVVGHEFAIQFLQASIRKGRLNRGYLLLGEPGSGRRFLAKAFAAAVVCQSSTETDACGMCQSCEFAAKEAHPDIRLIEAEGSSTGIKIQQIRDMLSAFSLNSALGRRRVGIIVDADTLTTEAANAVLKTLEEPPPSATLVLTGVSVDRVLPTIVSRCQVVRVAPLPDAVVAEWLQRHKDVEPERARMIAAASGGRIGRALDMLSDDWTAARERVVGALLNPSKDFSEALSLSDRAELSGELEIMAQWYRDALHVQQRGDDAPVVNVDRRRALADLARASDTERIAQSLEAIDRAHLAVSQYANAKIVVKVLELELRGSAARP